MSAFGVAVSAERRVVEGDAELALDVRPPVSSSASES